MPRYNIEHNGKWACFSSITDSFVTGFMNKVDYEEWRKAEYGIRSYKSVESCNIMPLNEAVYSVRFYSSREDTLKCLLECGLSEEDSVKVLDAVEEKHFQPELREDGRYLCPVCGEEMSEGQKICNGCNRELAWKVQKG